MKIIELPQATIALAPIPDQGDKSRRERERAAVQKLVDHAAGTHVDILHHDDGSPYPAEPCQLHISISHSRHIAALLWSSVPGWGIDIEEARQEQLSRIAARVLNQDEISLYHQNLLQAWTLKEATFKAAGLKMADLREIHLGDGHKITARAIQLVAMLSKPMEVAGHHGWLSVVRRLIP